MLNKSYRLSWYYSAINKWMSHPKHFFFLYFAKKFVAKLILKKEVCEKWRIIRIKDGKVVFSLIKKGRV